MNSSGGPINQNIIRIGGPIGVDSPALVVDFSKRDNVKTLVCAKSTMTASRYSSLQEAGAATQTPYQVPAGKKFYAPGFYTESGTANCRFMFGYGSAAVIAEDTATAPVGAIYYNSDTAPANTPWYADISSATPKWIYAWMVFPAGGFIWVSAGASGTHGVYMTGLEI